MPSQIISHTEAYELAVEQSYGLGELFHQQVRQRPSSLAVVDGDVSITYQQLHSKAVFLAEELRRGDFDLEEPVGIIVQHGWADVVSQIAIIYAGGSCAPMDPTLPDVQIQGRMQRLKARYALVDKVNQHRDLPFTKFIVDDERMSLMKESWASDTNLPILTSLEHRTHLIHTSGTTSEPKAVQIAGRSILQVAFHAPFEPVDPSDVVAHVNNTSFDVSLFDIWAPLLQGARIAVLSKVILLDLPAMAEHIDRFGITVMATTTALLNLAASTYPQAFAKLKTCFIGGEAANVIALETILTQGPPQQLINAYGPTECCIFCLAHRVTMDDVHAGRVSIGKPIGKGMGYICNENGQPLPDGEEGELCIGGAGVSPGYVNQPEKNFKAFTTLQTKAGTERVYHTGDIVRRRISDGQIDYIGRRDNQVKVRGFRIELEAVETAMLRTGQFSEAVALKVEAGNEGAGSLLVAFAVPVSNNSHAVLNAIDSLKALLPDYMVPQIELIQQMPLNNHAKVDRKHLNALYRQRWGTKKSSLAEDSPDAGTTQQRLANIWANIIGLPSPVEDDDADFFVLGATSLQASLLITQVRRAFGAEVSLLTLYDNSSLARLAAVIEAHQEGTFGTVRDEQHVWIEDTKLADHLEPPSAPVVDWRRDTEGRVFFTGATGFVGAFMLADLLRMPEVHQVGCLVRAADPATGFQRVKNGMAKYGQWEEQFSTKLLALPGTLELPHLGLGAERFHEIANWASVIFHLGARVNYTQPYSLHRPANVDGTVNILQLALEARPKAVHYVSSISCFGPTGFVTGSKLVTEDEPLLKHVVSLPYDHGYAQSQWVVEEMLRRLMERSFPIAVYRPGFITGHSKTGACNPDDFFSRLIHSCAEMGCYPLLSNQRKEFVPVDYVNATILHIASSPVSSLGHAYHIVPPSRSASIDMNDSMELLGSFTGQSKMSGIPYGDWIDELSQKAPARLQPLQPMLAEKAHDGRTRWELYENMPIYDTSNTMAALKSYPGGLAFPALDKELMGRYLRYLDTHS